METRKEAGGVGGRGPSGGKRGTLCGPQAGPGLTARAQVTRGSVLGPWGSWGLGWGLCLRRIRSPSLWSESSRCPSGWAGPSSDLASEQPLGSGLEPFHSYSLL